MTRRAQEVRNNLSMERGIVRSPSHKRLGEEDLTKKKRTKKRVYPLMDLYCKIPVGKVYSQKTYIAESKTEPQPSWP